MGSLGSIVDAMEDPMWDVMIAPAMAIMSVKPFALSLDSEWNV